MVTMCLGQKILQGGRFSVKEPKADSVARPKGRFVQAFGHGVTSQKSCSAPRSPSPCRKESAALKAEPVFLPPLTFRAACLFWHSTALCLRLDKTLVGLSEREIRWKSLKPGVEMEVL